MEKTKIIKYIAGIGIFAIGVYSFVKKEKWISELKEYNDINELYGSDNTDETQDNIEDNKETRVYHDVTNIYKEYVTNKKQVKKIS